MAGPGYARHRLDGARVLAAWAGVASPIAVTMDAPAASAPSAQLGLFVSFIQFRPSKVGKMAKQA